MLPTEHLVIVLAPHELSLFQFETVPKTRRDVIEMFTQLKHSSTSSFFLMGKVVTFIKQFATIHIDI
jgi:hypothetical protein